MLSREIADRRRANRLAEDALEAAEVLHAAEVEDAAVRVAVFLIIVDVGGRQANLEPMIRKGQMKRLAGSQRQRLEVRRGRRVCAETQTPVNDPRTEK